ncbi:hypothetical protein [Tardisphaera saccharovorans]
MNTEDYLQEAKKQLSIFKLLKKEGYDNRYTFIHLASAMEEFSKYAYLVQLKHNYLNKVNQICCISSGSDLIKSLDQLRYFIESIEKQIKKLDEDHECKYLLFLLFYEVIRKYVDNRLGSSLVQSNDKLSSKIQPIGDYEPIFEKARRILKLRNSYMLDISRKAERVVDLEKVGDLVDELIIKLEFVLGNASAIDQICSSNDDCKELYSNLAEIYDRC